MALTLDAKIQEWLANQGYPLELHVARHFEDFCTRVDQNEHYEDPRTKESREIDVLGSLYYEEIVSDPKFSVGLEFQIVTECKSSRTPWVGFARKERLTAIDLFRAFPASKSLRELLDEFFLHGRLAGTLVGRPSCYSVVAALREKNSFDLAHHAVKAAQAGAEAQSKRWDYEQPDFLDEDFALVTTCIPLVVTDAPLFLARLNKKNEIELKEVDFLTYYSRSPSVANGKTVVVIATKGRLRAASKVLVQLTKSVTDYLSGLDAKKVWKEITTPYLPELTFKARGDLLGNSKTE